MNTPFAPVIALGAEEIVTVLVTEPREPAFWGELVEQRAPVEETIGAISLGSSRDGRYHTL